MFCIIKWKKHDNEYLAEKTDTPGLFRVIEPIHVRRPTNKIKVGHITGYGKTKEITFLDTEEKLGEFLLRHRL